MHHPTDRITHTMVFVTPVVEHWLEREIAQWVHTMEALAFNDIFNTFLTMIILRPKVSYIYKKNFFRLLIDGCK